MKKFLNSKYGEAIVLAAISALNFLFIIIYYSLPLNVTSEVCSLWSASSIDTEAYHIDGLNTYFVLAFWVGIALFAAGATLCFVKQKKILYYVTSVYNAVLSVAVIIVGIALHILSAKAIVWAILSLLMSIGTIAFLHFRKSAPALKESEEVSENSKSSFICKMAMLICESVATIVMLALLFLPMYYEQSKQTISYTLAGTLTNAKSPLFMYIAFLVMFVLCFVELLKFVTTVSFYKYDNVFAQKSRSYMYSVTMFTLAFFIIGYCFTFYLNIANNAAEQANYSAGTTAYIPFICSVVILIVFSVFYGKSGLGENIAESQSNAIKLKIEPLIYVAILTVITFSTLIFNVITITCEVSGSVISTVSLNGHELLSTYYDLESGFQIMASVLMAMLIVSSMMLVLSIASLISKNKDYYKVIKTSAIANLVFVALIGLFGIYFKIAQKINEENMLSLLEHFHITFLPEYKYNVQSSTIYLLFASLIVIVIMIVRKQFNLTVEEPISVKVESGPKNESAELPLDNAAKQRTDGEYERDFATTDFDACPAFTELDGKQEQFAAETTEKRKYLFTNLTLPNLVRFVVDYARECRLHLSYSLEDMATFVAGLGASRLTILQGMSGTGKTSLPKIFAEALLGNCEIVEVESSWRDKNELLGYYNEFSKCYTPKKFTQCLYKAKLNPEVLTFIVLDEMNLSRIEYYFSDFLSLMENEEDKREIKLLNIKLNRLEKGEKVPYCGLCDGHTLKVPTNVWFIGTANRDESTFAISDKVYDRAQTMNFNKRAPKIHSFSEPLPQRFAPYDSLKKLFDEAKNNGVFEAEESIVVQQVEKLLAPYNISFGNRILKQMEDFVKIYCACFGDRDAVQKDAIEKILLSKVVSKLENKVVENKEALAAEFDKIGLYACSEFVRKLNED